MGSPKNVADMRAPAPSDRSTQSHKSEQSQFQVATSNTSQRTTQRMDNGLRQHAELIINRRTYVNRYKYVQIK